jgi:dephospho-CoA kinase
VIGLSGGIGAGKSTVARLLAELGAAIIDSDVLNTEVLAEPSTVRELRNWFGDKTLGKDGAVDRKALADILFADDEARQRVERLLHPRIAARRAALEARYQADDQVSAIVLDSPLLYESQLDRHCDRVIFVEADDACRYARASAGRGWSRQEHVRRENVQKGLDFKRTRADYIVQNNSSMDVLRRQVHEVFSQIITSVAES